jgi:hypothetical protein
MRLIELPLIASRSAEKMTEKERPTAAFVLSVISGVFTILGGGMTSMFSYWLWGGYHGGYGGWRYGMMGPGFGMMGYPGYGMMGWAGFGFFGILGIVFGAIVIISAVMLNSRPREHTTWGTLIVIFSAISIFGHWIEDKLSFSRVSQNAVDWNHHRKRARVNCSVHTKEWVMAPTHGPDGMKLQRELLSILLPTLRIEVVDF